MYRDDLAAAHARMEQLQRELADASSQGVQDRQRIAALTAQLAAAKDALARVGTQAPYPSMPGLTYPSRASTVLALGIVSIVACHVIGPIAWSMGNEELRRIDSGQTDALTRGNVVAGRICGIIGTSLLVLTGVAILIVLMAVAASSH